VADKIELVGELTTLESGLVVAQRTKHLCRWCGAAFERDLGAQLHESQCRHGARLRLLGDALGGAVASKGAEAVVDLVTCVMAAIEAKPRTTWTET